MRNQLTNDEVMMLAGYVNPLTLCNAVMEKWVRPEAMKELAERMELAWGGSQGVVDFCGIHIEFGVDKAKLFLEHYAPTDYNGNQNDVFHFENEEERQSWLDTGGSEEHWEIWT